MHKEIQFHQLSTTGDRETNQDCMASRVGKDYALFVVADGLGGHHAGEKASQFFCQGMFEQADKFYQLFKDNQHDVKDIVYAWVAAAVTDMTRLFADEPEAKNAHTTCVILYMDENQVVTAHCGDSRIYRMNEQQLLWRTKDHSLIQKQRDEGEISEREMGLHPEQNKLTRSINIQNFQQPEIRVFPPMRRGETFILCTDGFWEFIKEKDLLLLAQQGVDKDDLMKVAKTVLLRAQGKSDNLTVQWVRRC